MQPTELQEALLQHLEKGPVTRRWAESAAGVSAVKELIKYGYIAERDGTVCLSKMYPVYKKYGWRDAIEVMIDYVKRGRLSKFTGCAPVLAPEHHEYLEAELKRMGVAI